MKKLGTGNNTDSNGASITLACKLHSSGEPSRVSDDNNKTRISTGNARLIGTHKKGQVAFSPSQGETLLKVTTHIGPRKRGSVSANRAWKMKFGSFIPSRKSERQTSPVLKKYHTGFKNTTFNRTGSTLNTPDSSTGGDGRNLHQDPVVKIERNPKLERNTWMKLEKDTRL